MNGIDAMNNVVGKKLTGWKYDENDSLVLIFEEDNEITVNGNGPLDVEIKTVIKAML